MGPDGRASSSTTTTASAAREARRLGIKNIASTRGLPFGQRSYEHSTCVDVGASRSASRTSTSDLPLRLRERQAEGPYDERRSDGIDALCTSLLRNASSRANVYAELGSTWRFLMRDPDAGALRWASCSSTSARTTCCGAPTRSGTARRRTRSRRSARSRIAEPLQQRHGYPAITPAMRAKVFGRNALRIYKVADDVLRHHLPRDRVRARARGVP
jgi:hypothetical protein